MTVARFSYFTWMRPGISDDELDGTETIFANRGASATENSVSRRSG